MGGGVELDCLEVVTEKRMLLVNILNNISHFLHDMLVEKRSVFSSRPARCCTRRHRRSFLPVAIRFFHSSRCVAALTSVDWEAAAVLLDSNWTYNYILCNFW